MMARDRHTGKGRRTGVKARAGIAATVLASGAVAAAVVVATGQPATGHPAALAAPAVRAAAYAARPASEGSVIASALRDWGRSRPSAYAQLARLTRARQFSQVRYRGRTLAVQRGIVVLATKKFLVVRSSHGSPHLWLLSRGTKFADVSNTAAGIRALTGSAGATRQAISSGNMIPATTLLAGSPTTAAALLTPAPGPQTVSVHVAGTDLTVTVTVIRNTAMVAQTAAMPLGGRPRWHPVTFTQNAWQATRSVARGDLVLVVGTRSRGTLRARLVLFAPLSTAAAGGRAAAAPARPALARPALARPAPARPKAVIAPTAAPTHW